MREAEVGELERLCSAAQSDLVRNGFSVADAAIMAWIMTKTHRDAETVGSMAHPACLENKQRELSRFGVSTAEIPDALGVAASPIQTQISLEN